MKRDDRRQEIMEQLVAQGTVDLEDLAERFAVSKMTIHRDLDQLEEAGLLRKVRGGASIESSTQFESDFLYREQRATAEKRLIAHAALKLVEPGMTVIINDGSTAGLLGELLAEKRPLTVITNNKAVIDELHLKQGITVMALGGVYSRKFNGFFGITTDESLGRLKADIAFISTPAIEGMNVYHMDEDVVRTKRCMIAATKRAYLMADHLKFGRTALHYMADINEFEGVIVNQEPDAQAVLELNEAGIKLILADKEIDT